MNVVGNAFPDVGFRVETPVGKPNLLELLTGPFSGAVERTAEILGMPSLGTISSGSIGRNDYMEIKIGEGSPNVASGALNRDASGRYTLNVNQAADGNYYLANPLAVTSGERSAVGLNLSGTDAAGSSGASRSLETPGVIATDTPLPPDLVAMINQRLNDTPSIAYWNHVGTGTTVPTVHIDTVPAELAVIRHNSEVMPPGAGNIAYYLSNSNPFGVPFSGITPDTFSTLGFAPDLLSLKAPTPLASFSARLGAFGQIVDRPQGSGAFDIGSLNNVTFGLEPRPLRPNNLQGADLTLGGGGKFTLDSTAVGGFTIEPALPGRGVGVFVEALDGRSVEIPQALVSAVSGTGLTVADINTVKVWIANNAGQPATLTRSFEQFASQAVEGQPLSEDARTQLLNNIRIIMIEPNAP